MDQLISLKIPSDKVAMVLEGFLKIYPNIETIPDPAWVEPDPPDGSKAPRIPKYTTKQWVVEKIRRIIVRDIHRGLTMIKKEQDVIEKDDGMVENA